MDSIIKGKHTQKKEEKPKGAILVKSHCDIDNEIQEIYEATLEEHKDDPRAVKQWVYPVVVTAVG